MEFTNISVLLLMGISFLISLYIIIKISLFWRHTSAETFIADVFITISGLVISIPLLVLSLTSFEDALSAFMLKQYVGERAKGKNYVVLCANDPDDHTIAFENGRDAYTLYRGDELKFSDKLGLSDKKGRLIEQRNCRPYEKTSARQIRLICLADKFDVKRARNRASFNKDWSKPVFTGVPLKKLHGGLVDELAEKIGLGEMKFYYESNLYRGGLLRDYEDMKVFADNLPFDPDFVSGYCAPIKEVKKVWADCQGRDGKVSGAFYQVGKYLVSDKMRKVKAKDFYIDGKEAKNVDAVLVEKYFEMKNCKVKK